MDIMSDEEVKSPTSCEMASDEIIDDDAFEVEKETDISPNKDGKLIKTIIRKGQGWEKPGNGDKVQVHYVGKLENGVQFDSSRDRNELFSFLLGGKEVIDGWDIAVKTMKRGELALFKIDSTLAYGERGSPPSIPPNATLLFEIELFDWKLEDITKRKDGGVCRRILQDGEDWNTPNKGSTCSIEYIGKYEGRVFEQRSVNFFLGEGSEESLVPAIEVAVRKMKKNERCEIIAKPAYLWGPGKGKPEFGIPDDFEEVRYEIWLKSYENVKETYELDSKERIEQAILVKTKGTKYFKESKYKLAIKQYKRVLQYLGLPDDFDGELKKSACETMLAGNLNLAMCYLKLENYIEALKACDNALKIDPTNAKGLFRRGQAYVGLHEYELGKKDFHKVLESDPNNNAAKSQIINCNAKIKEHREKEKMKYKNMFEIFAKRDSQKVASQTSSTSISEMKVDSDNKITSSSTTATTSGGDEQQQQDNTAAATADDTNIATETETKS